MDTSTSMALSVQARLRREYIVLCISDLDTEHVYSCRCACQDLLFYTAVERLYILANLYQKLYRFTKLGTDTIIHRLQEYRALLEPAKCTSVLVSVQSELAADHHWVKRSGLHTTP